MERNCKYCNETFQARRRNHVYCNTSCKTMASYKRNDYKYVAGHYEKQEEDKKEANMALDINKVETATTRLEERVKNMDKVNVSAISNSAIGNMAASAVTHGMQKLFAPNTLPATKGDLASLKNEISELKALLYSR